MGSVFDGMAAERAKSVLMRQETFGWRVNPAALFALRDEGAIDVGYEPHHIDQLYLFGLPIYVDGEDGSEEPRFRLIADKPEGGRPAGE